MNKITFKKIQLIQPLPEKLCLSQNVCQQLKPLGINIEKRASFSRNLMFERGVNLRPDCAADKLKIGSYSYCSYRTTLVAASVGRYCSIGYNSEVGVGYHQMDGLTTSTAVQFNISFMDYSGYIPLRRDQLRPDGEASSLVRIGHDVWVGCNCLFPKDVTIGHGAVIGAGSIITHDVPPYAIVAGVGGGENSKGIIKGYRFPDEIISDLLELSWWDYDIPKMISQGIKVPIHNIKDFISFMKNEAREKLIPLPKEWYYLNTIDYNTAEVYHVDPEQTDMGSIVKPANIAIINDPERGAEPIVIKTQD